MGKKKTKTYASFIIFFKELQDAIITVKKQKKKQLFPKRSLCKLTVKRKIRR